MHRHTRGFTLIELVAIIVILGVLAGVTASRYNTASSELLSSRDDLVAALFYAQQLAMARAGINGNTITLIATVNSIDVQVDGASLASDAYPVSLPSGVAITMGTGTQTYAKLGTTQSNTFILTDAQGSTASVNLDASGYAYF